VILATANIVAAGASIKRDNDCTSTSKVSCCDSQGCTRKQRLADNHPIEGNGHRSWRCSSRLDPALNCQNPPLAHRPPLTLSLFQFSIALRRSKLLVVLIVSKDDLIAIHIISSFLSWTFPLGKGVVGLTFVVEWAKRSALGRGQSPRPAV